jgi:hypothetical protein
VVSNQSDIIGGSAEGSQTHLVKLTLKRAS